MQEHAQWSNTDSTASWELPADERTTRNRRYLMPYQHEKEKDGAVCMERPVT